MISHLNKKNIPKMVDVSKKRITKRLAIAEGIVKFPKSTFKKIESNLNKSLYNAITIWPFAAYGRSHTRSPSIEWWQRLINILINKKIDIIHCGYINEPDLMDEEKNNKYYQKVTNLSFFEQIKISLGSNFSIGTDSGSRWTLGAYQHPSIHLMTNWADQHKTNYSCFQPINVNSSTLFAEESCNNIKIEDVLQLCNKRYSGKKFSLKGLIDNFI